jgi:hypothetical protein
MIFDAPMKKLGFKTLKKIEVTAANSDLLAKVLGLPASKTPAAGTVYIVQKTTPANKSAPAKKPTSHKKPA